MESGNVWAAFIGSILTTVIGAIVWAIIKLSNNRFSQNRVTRRDTIEDLWKLVDSLKVDIDFQKTERKKDNDRHDDQMRDLERDHADCQRTQARMEAWIEAAEDVLRKAGNPIRLWSQTRIDQSGPHTPLPMQGDQDAKP